MDLFDYAEHPHTGGWTLRSSLVRLAQPHPEKVSDLLAQTRRLDTALKDSRSEISVYTEAQRQDSPLIGIVAELDELAQCLSAWANTGPADPPLEAIDQTTTSVTAALDQLGVAADAPRQQLSDGHETGGPIGDQPTSSPFGQKR